ncbi:hypothetical protein M9H77_11692 [Catharanthus roseus]|uniref:Uncharacterized protein n=1 Tax=Catharanthus roseus TaxID=4058 RepID=A0ACC0BFD6_CATRO|nr:hypothetical protein M9H77_11692 [Catharanthus roseus]
MSQRVLPDNFVVATVVFCKGFRYSWFIPGDCPKIPVEGPPNPISPTNIVVARIFCPLVPFAALREEVVRGLDMLQRLLVSIGPTHPLFPPFQPEF